MEKGPLSFSGLMTKINSNLFLRLPAGKIYDLFWLSSVTGVDFLKFLKIPTTHYVRSNEERKNQLYLNLNSFQICYILSCEYEEVTEYLSITVAPFGIKFQRRNLEKDQLADAPIPLP